MYPAFVSVMGVAKDRQDFNSEEASSNPGANAKKTHGSEESSKRNTINKKTDSKKQGQGCEKACFTG